MSGPVWEFVHGVECGAPRVFAWAYWTNAENWDDPPARFEFDGPFKIGTRIKAKLPGQELESTIREVVEGQAARIEMDRMGAVVAFDWNFEELDVERTRITQQIRLSGAGAGALVEQAKMLEQSVPQGMARLVQHIERKWAEKRNARDDGAPPSKTEDAAP